MTAFGSFRSSSCDIIGYFGVGGGGGVVVVVSKHIFCCFARSMASASVRGADEESHVELLLFIVGESLLPILSSLLLVRVLSGTLVFLSAVCCRASNMDTAQGVKR